MRAWGVGACRCRHAISAGSRLQPGACGSAGVCPTAATAAHTCRLTPSHRRPRRRRRRALPVLPGRAPTPRHGSTDDAADPADSLHGQELRLEEALVAARPQRPPALRALQLTPRQALEVRRRLTCLIACLPACMRAPPAHTTPHRRPPVAVAVASALARTPIRTHARSSQQQHARLLCVCVLAGAVSAPDRGISSPRP